MNLNATVVTRTGDLNIRANASMSGKIIAKLPKGTRVTITDDPGNGWAAIRYGDIAGYASAQYLQIDLTPSEGEVRDEPTDTETTTIENEAGVKVILLGRWSIAND